MQKTYYKSAAKAALAGGTSVLAMLATPASAQTICTPLLGLLNCAPITTTAPVQLPGQTQPVNITLPDLYAATSTIVADSTDSISLIANGAVSAITTGGPGLDLTSGANITAQITALATSGNGAGRAAERGRYRGAGGG